MLLMIYDLHIHSKYSYDSILTPEMIIKVAKKKGINGVAITDHNSIKGGLKTFKANQDKDFQIAIGTEIKTEYGDIIGIFLNEDIKSRDFLGVIEEIREQGGYSILPHPFRKHISPEKLVNKIDLVEVFNARSLKSENMKSHCLAKESNKPITVGSDAHLPFEIGRGILIAKDGIRTIVKEKNPGIAGRESNYYLVHGLSIIAEKIKKVSAK